MKIDKLAQRLQKDRPMTMVSIRIPDDVIDDLKRVAPMLGFSGYQALIKAYIGQGLRSDLERLEGGVELSALVESLRKKGVKDEIISSAIAEVQSSIHRLSQVSRLGRRVSQILKEEGVSQEALLNALDEERPSYYREHNPKDAP